MDDDALLAALGEALGRDEPPDGMIDRTLGLLTWMDVDAEIEALLQSADAIDLELAGARSTTDAADTTVDDTLLFQAEDGSSVVELSVARDQAAGQVVAGDVTHVALEGLSGTIAEADVDDLGQFTLSPIPSGPARLRLRAGGTSVVTSWFTL